MLFRSGDSGRPRTAAHHGRHLHKPNNNRSDTMSTFHPRRLLLATAVASLALPVVAEEHGFLEDASANLNLRNFLVLDTVPV